MTTLKRCPCGEVPESVDFYLVRGGRLGYASPSCCGGWVFLFEVKSNPLVFSQTKVEAEAAWNDAPRGESKAIPDHICGLCYHPKQEADCCDRDDCDIRGKTSTTKEKAG
jgi:hypothetical protein